MRAGTGGDEAALFAADLFRMYPRYTEMRGWKVEIISLSENDLGGYKEIVAGINGAGSVRAAQVRERSASRPAQSRPPKRRAHPHVGCDRRDAARGGGRRHRHDATRTSASTPCGQAAPADSTSTRRTAPCGSRTAIGLVVASAEKSQHQNRRGHGAAEIAPFELSASAPTASGARSAQDPSGIRRPLGAHPHLQLPARPVTDHRINLTLHNIDRVMEGVGLDEIIDQLIAEDQASALAAMQNDGA